MTQFEIFIIKKVFADLQNNSVAKGDVKLLVYVQEEEEQLFPKTGISISFSIFYPIKNFTDQF